MAHGVWHGRAGGRPASTIHYPGRCASLQLLVAQLTAVHIGPADSSARGGRTERRQAAMRASEGVAPSRDRTATVVLRELQEVQISHCPSYFAWRAPTPAGPFQPLIGHTAPKRPRSVPTGSLPIIPSAAPFHIGDIACWCGSRAGTLAPNMTSCKGELAHHCKDDARLSHSRCGSSNIVKHWHRLAASWRYLRWRARFANAS
ncbi:hypothetical protein Q7P37_005950 [Cladosporium fusiforme]